MTEMTDKHLDLIEQKLRFIARESQRIEDSYDVIDEINFAVVSALRALDEHKQTLRPEHEESLTGVGLAA